uniref:Uncharacterized protein n=1 Tax=Arundo donax TaxID=35708 RepID=A0A0A9GWM5_ARUDO
MAGHRRQGNGLAMASARGRPARWLA